MVMSILSAQSEPLLSRAVLRTVDTRTDEGHSWIVQPEGMSGSHGAPSRGYPTGHGPRPRRSRVTVPTAATGPHAERIRRTAERFFGHPSLLPGQAETMGALLDGRDVLLISPTGSGKSLSYQVAGVLLEGCT